MGYIRYIQIKEVVFTNQEYKCNVVVEFLNSVAGMGVHRVVNGSKANLTCKM